MNPAWLEIDCSAVARNVGLVRARVAPRGGVLTVLKSDAYGMGCVEVARAVRDGGASFIGVGIADEATRLKEAAIDLPVLLMHTPLEEEIAQVVESNCAVAVSDFRTAALLSAEASRRSKTVDVHLAVETGMNRMGFLPGDLLKRWRDLFQLPGLRYSGIFSHFSSADISDPSPTRSEFAKFESVLKELEARGGAFRYRHISNSAAVLNYPEFSLDLVRAGILIYGVEPAPPAKKEISFESAVSLKTRVVHVSNLNQGDTVSYHRTWKAPRSGNIATIPAGYADGIQKSISGAGEALIGGNRFPYAGLVCMDLTVLFTGEFRATPGDEVVLIGKQGGDEITVADWARWGNLDPHEILTGLGKKLPKIYVHSNGQSRAVARSLQNPKFGG